jgi:DNA repair protein RecO (recombination protein O)
MPTYPANGLVVRRLNLGETDKILTLYTREHGKLSAVAKGARRSTSRLTGATELFTASRLLLATGRSLDIVTQCEIRDSFPGLRADLERLARATYFCELLDALSLERDATTSAEAFDLTLAALSLLQQAAESLDAIVHAYELRLLALMGYAPVLDHCVRCESALDRRQGGFSPSLGGALCAGCRHHADDAVTLGVESLDLLRSLLDLSPAALLTLRPTPRAEAEVSRALRWFVRFRSERPLKSADFLDTLRASH